MDKMLKRFCIFALSVLLSAGRLPAANTDVRVNSVGFLPTQAKHASVSLAGSSFTVNRASDNGVAYSGFVTGETSSVLSGPLAYSGSSQGAINLGSYVITPGGLTSGNYIISYYNGALTINQATSSIPQQNAYNNILYVTVLNFNGTTTTTFIKGGQDNGIKKQALPYCN